MNQLRLITVTLLGITIFGCNKKATVEDLKIFAATENYPDDVSLDTIINKRALVIVAHDDDDCAMSGTIAKLTANGWTIEQLSLKTHILPETGKNPAGIICQGNRRLLQDGYYRIGLDTIQSPYLPIPNEKISEQFLTEKVAGAIIQNVNAFIPAVIFTLDVVKGGYGHPEHIFISRLVKELFESGIIKTQRLYQSVYTDHMEREIVDKWLGERLKKWGHPSASDMANKMYGINGMPEPTVQIKISDVAEIKMKYLRSYGEDVRKNLRKFIPYFEDFDARSYFNIFDKEYFRVIEKPGGHPPSGQVI